MKYCINCGTELLPNANFCPSCGNKISRTENQSRSHSSVTEDQRSEESTSSGNASSSKSQKAAGSTENRSSYVQSSGSNSGLSYSAFTSSQKKVIITSIIIIALVIFVIIRFTNDQDTNGINSSGYTGMGAQNDIDQSAAKIEADNKAARLAAITERNMSIRNNWESYIIASRSGFKYSDLGGISDLSIIITNKTEYVIDRVYVAVDIITVNGYKHKTEYLFFQNIKPHSRQQLQVPPTTRGTSVEYRITNVYSNSLNFKWDEGDHTGNGSLNDPWKTND